MRRRGWQRLAWGVLLGMVWTCALVSAHVGDSHVPAGDSHVAAVSPAQRYFTDVRLVNQDGESMRFYSDLLKGHVVVVNSFYANCPAVCPVLTQKLAGLQDALRDRLGKDLRFLSLSVDPETDTPAALKAYATKFKARPGWYFLTGPRQNVEFALYKLGQYVEAKDNHTNLLIVGNETTGLWKKAFGMARPAALLRLIQGVLDDRPNGLQK